MNWIRRIIYFGGSAIDLLKVVLVVIITLVLIHFFLGTIFIVSGESMEPNFHDGQLVFSNKIGYLVGDPSRGDSVVVMYPGDPTNKRYIKRVIALPGERIRIQESKISILKNNQFIDYTENFIPLFTVTEPDGDWLLKDNEYFLMGDNRPNSNDSRFFGPVERRFIFGHATMVLWPQLKSVD